MPTPTQVPNPTRSIGKRLAIGLAVVAGVLGVAGAGFGILMWSTFEGIRPMEHRERIGSALRLVDGYVSCFLVDDGTGRFFLIDTCSSTGGELIEAALAEAGRTTADVRAILFTHGHVDHTAAAARFEFAAVHAHEDERPLLAGEVAARGPLPRLSGRGARIEVDEPLVDGQRFSIGQRRMQVFHLPGHTDGSVAYLIDDAFLLLGDNAHAMEDGRMESAPWVFSDDIEANRVSLRAFAQRIERERIEPEQLVFSHSGSLPPGALQEWAAGQKDQ